MVKAATGEDVTKEELGGPAIAVELTGTAHDVVEDDAAAIERAREYLRRMPASAWELPPLTPNGDVGERRIPELLALIPPNDRKAYSMRGVLDLVFDGGSLLELQAEHGRSIVTALASIGGHQVAVVANDPGVKAGALDSDAAHKAARFIELVGAFHFPVVFLADNPGVLAGTRAEREGVLRAAARMFAAQHRLTVPKLHVTLRKAFGFGSSVMAMNPYDAQTISYAFPGVTLGAMPAESGGSAAKLDTDAHDEVRATQRGGPWPQATGMGYDDIIDPAELRNALLRALPLLEARRVAARPQPVARIGTLP